MAIEKTVILKADTRQAQGSVKDLENSIGDVDQEIQNTGSSTVAMGGALDRVTGGAVTKFGAMRGALTTVIASFRTLRVAIMATGIGALIIAITAVGQAFTRSEKGQNQFRKIMNIIGSVVGNVLDIFADIGEKIIAVFSDPRQAILDFKDLLIQNVTNRFMALLDTFKFVGSAFKKLFKGQFQGAINDVKKAGSKMVDSFTGVNNTLGKTAKAVKSFAKEVKKDAASAAKISDQQASADRKARDLVVKRAEAERKIAELREKAADKEKFSSEERIKFLQEAGKISTDVANEEIEVSKLRLSAKRAENALARSNKADLDEEAELQASVTRAETARLKLQKSLTAELTTARRENAAAQKAINAEAAAAQKVIDEEEKKRKDNILKIQEEFNRKLQDLDAKNDVEKVNLEEERKIAELDRLNATEQQKLEVRKFYAALRLKAEEKDSKEREKLEDNVNKAKINIAKRGLALIGEVAGKGSKLGKQVAIAQATISAIEGTQNAFTTAQDSKITTVFPAYPFIQAGLAAGFGALQVAKIKSTDASGSSVPSLGADGGAGGSQAPSFNVVGATETSQLADAVAGQTQEPVQAFVVANDVTTAQSLENNIVEGATL